MYDQLSYWLVMELPSSLGWWRRRPTFSACCSSALVSLILVTAATVSLLGSVELWLGGFCCHWFSPVLLLSLVALRLKIQRGGMCSVSSRRWSCGASLWVASFSGSMALSSAADLSTERAALVFHRHPLRFLFEAPWVSSCC